LLIQTIHACICHPRRLPVLRLTASRPREGIIAISAAGQARSDKEMTKETQSPNSRDKRRPA
jgi:hypothetical protein